MKTESTHLPAQASDEQAALSKQLTIWRAEVARLNDLIAHASGVQASDEPMRAESQAAFERYLEKQKYIVGMLGLAAQPCYTAGYQAGFDAATPRATADAERDAARYKALMSITDFWAHTCLLPVIDWMRDWPVNQPDIDAALDEYIAATKGAKP